MRTFTRTLLILSLIKFARAAPAAVRERPEARLDANVRGDVTALSQKRWDPLELRGSPNVPKADGELPPNPETADWSELIRMMGTGEQDSIYTPQMLHDNTLPPLVSMGSSDHVPPSPGLPTGSRVPMGSAPVAGSLPQPPPHTGPSEDRFPGRPGSSVSPDKLSSIASTDSRLTPPEMDPELHSLLHPEPFPTEFWDKMLKGMIKARFSGSDDVDSSLKDQDFTPL